MTAIASLLCTAIGYCCTTTTAFIGAATAIANTAILTAIILAATTATGY